MDVGEVLVKIQGDVTGLTAAVNQAIKTLDKVSESTKRQEQQSRSSFEQIGAAATRMAGLLGIAFSANYFINFAKNAMETVGRMNDLADQVDISAATLAGLKSVAEEAGSSIEVFARSAFNTTRQLSEVSSKSDPVYLGIKRLGLSFNELRTMKSEDAIRTIAVAMDGLTSRTEKVQIATAFWGSRLAKEMLPVLDAMAHGVDTLNQSLTADQIARIDQMTDAWTRLSNQLQFHMADAVLGAKDALQSIFDLIQLNMSNDVIAKFFGFAPAAPTGKSPLMTKEEYQKSLPKQYTGSLVGLAPAGGFGETPILPIGAIDKVTEAMKRQAIAAKAAEIAITSGDAAAAKYKLTEETLLGPMGQMIVDSDEFKTALAELGSAMGGVPATQLAQSFRQQAIAIEAQRLALTETDAEVLRYTLSANAMIQLHTTKLPAAIQQFIDKLVALKDAADKTKDRQDALRAGGEQYVRMVKDMADAANKLSELSAKAGLLGLSDMNRELEESRRKWADMRMEILKAWDYMSDLPAALKDIDRAQAREQAAIRQKFAPEDVAQARLEALINSFHDLTGSMAEVEIKAQLFGNSFDLTSAALDVQNQAVTNLIEQYLNLRDTGTATAQELADAWASVVAASKNVRITEGRQRAEQLGANIANSFATGIRNTLEGVETGQQTLGDAMKNMVRNMALELQFTIFDQTILGPIKMFAQGFVTGLVGAIDDEFEQNMKRLGEKLGAALNKMLSDLMKSSQVSKWIGMGLSFLGNMFGGASAGVGAGVGGDWVGAGINPAGGGFGAGAGPGFAAGGPLFNTGLFRGHAGEVVLNNAAVRRLGGMSAANALNAGRGGMSGGNVQVSLDFQGAQIIPRAPWTTPDEVIKVSTKHINDDGVMVAAMGNRLSRRK